MGQHTEVTFTFTRGIGAATQGRAEQSFVARESAFSLPALTVFASVETSLHLPPVLGLWPLAALATPVDWDDRGADAQILAAQAMIFFAVEGGVTQHAIPRDDQSRLFHGRGKLRPIVAGTRADGGRGEEVAAGVTHNGQFAPQTCGLLFTRASEVVA